MNKKLLLLKFMASILALLSIFYSVYIVLVFVGFMVYLCPNIYADEKKKLKYKTEKIIKLLKIDTIVSVIGITYLILIISVNNHIGKVDYYFYAPLLVCLLPMIYADLYRRRLLKEEEIRDTTY
ncbi:MAG: hypothetical protein Q3988_06335 [Gemella sp.]|nr:hypothetical protein [Gemella sp.]